MGDEDPARTARTPTDACFRALIERGDELTLLCDALGVIVYASPSLAALTGFAREDLVGRARASLVHPDDLAAAGALVDDLAAGAAVTVAMRLACRDGSFRAVRGVRHNLLDEPTVRAVVDRLRNDATVDDAALEPRDGDARWYQRLFQRSSLAQWLYDVDTLRLVDVNDAALRASGHTRDELLGMSLLDLQAADEVATRGADVSPRDRRGAQRSVVWRHRRKDGTLLTVEAAIHSFSDGGRHLALATARNLAEERRTEEALRAANARFLVFSRQHVLQRAVVDLRDVVVAAGTK